MIFARDKLQEAEFFLDRLREHDSGRDFRYYLSAFLSAARSVTWVLQAELKSKYGDEFERWYEPHQRTLAVDRIARIVKEARNILLKRGSREPVYTSTYRSPLGAESVSISWTIDQLADDAPSPDIHISLDPGQFRMSVEIDASLPVEQQQEQVDAQVAQGLELLAPVFLERAQAIVQEVEPEILVSLLGEDAIPASILLSDLQTYVESLRRLIDDADARFPPT
jgi:hypothetical protein